MSVCVCKLLHAHVTLSYADKPWRSKALTLSTYQIRLCILLAYMHMSMHTLVYCIHTCLYRLVICEHTGGTQRDQQCLYNACYMDIVRGILYTFLPVLYREIVLSTSITTPQNFTIPSIRTIQLLTNLTIYPNRNPYRNLSYFPYPIKLYMGAYLTQK